MLVMLCLGVARSVAQMLAQHAEDERGRGRAEEGGRRRLSKANRHEAESGGGCQGRPRDRAQRQPGGGGTIAVVLERGASHADRTTLGELSRRRVERCSARELHHLVLRFLMEWVEEAEDLADEPLRTDAITIAACAAGKVRPTPLHADSDWSPADLVHTGAMQLISIRVRRW